MEQNLYHTALTLVSQNKKVGPGVAVSTTSRHSCPSSCPLTGANGCYADAGYYTRMFWDKVTAGKAGLSPELYIEQVKLMPRNAMLRHNVAGDLWPDPYFPKQIDPRLLGLLSRATKHLYAAWTYTHHTLEGVDGASNTVSIKFAEAQGFIVNVSTESKDLAAELHKKGFMVTVVQPEGLPTAFRHNGVKFVQCPATLPGSQITCTTCGGRYKKPLCATKRDVVVVFPVHGNRKVSATKQCS